MPDQLFTYHVENPLVIISIISGIWGIGVIRLDIEICVIGKGGTELGVARKGVSG
jgi:hypothetical protein